MKRELQLILVLLFLIIVLVKVAELFKSEVVEADASKFVTEDLRAKYPDADISVMSIKQMHNGAGTAYFEVKAKVTLEPNGPCPERMHIYYNYPEQNFVSQPNEYITSNCAVCTEGICILAFPEEAIIASHTFEGTGDVAAYLERYPSAYPVISEKPDSWVVLWDTPLALEYYTVEIGKDGTLVSIRQTPKS